MFAKNKSKESRTPKAKTVVALYPTEQGGLKGTLVMANGDKMSILFVEAQGELESRNGKTPPVAFIYVSVFADSGSRRGGGYSKKRY